MRINVTQKHIDEGVKEDCNFCPVALAFLEATGKAYMISSRYIYDERGIYRDKLPPEVIAWIKNYDGYGEDDGYKPEPFFFDIEL
jgi:hypothetical protein